MLQLQLCICNLATTDERPVSRVSVVTAAAFTLTSLLKPVCIYFTLTTVVLAQQLTTAAAAATGNSVPVTTTKQAVLPCATAQIPRGCCA
jgi:hypothetical protein